ncbi:MAG: SHOCT-like domain-containing protein [Bacillota bacterium]
MNEESLKILKMIEVGKITAEEGSKLLEALGDTPDETAQLRASAAPEKKDRILRVVVDTRGHGEEDAKVRVNIPLEVAKKVAKFTAVIPKDAKKEMQENGIDIDAIDLEGLIEMFVNGQIDENLVDIETGNNGKGASVKVYVD